MRPQPVWGAESEPSWRLLPNPEGLNGGWRLGDRKVKGFRHQGDVEDRKGRRKPKLRQNDRSAAHVNRRT